MESLKHFIPCMQAFKVGTEGNDDVYNVNLIVNLPDNYYINDTLGTTVGAVHNNEADVDIIIRTSKIQTFSGSHANYHNRTISFKVPLRTKGKITTTVHYVNDNGDDTIKERAVSYGDLD